MRHVNGLGFPRYLSLAALLTSFLRGLLNKAIPHAEQEGQGGVTSNPGRCRSRRDIGFVFTTQSYRRKYVHVYVYIFYLYAYASNILSMLHRGQGRGYRIGPTVSFSSAAKKKIQHKRDTWGKN